MNVKSKTLNPFLCICLLIVAVILCTSCTKKLVETSIKTDKIKNKILIAADATEFKDTILKRFITAYQSDYNIEIVNIDKLNSINIDDYSGILIMDTCMAWTGFNLSLKSFLEKRKHRDKTVLFITAGDPDWKYSYKEIDAVTSASEITNEEVVFTELTGRMETLLSTR